MPGFSTPDVSRCLLQPTVHLLQRMAERGVTSADVDEAVYRGTKVWESPTKFKGVSASCMAVVAAARCHLTVLTAWRY